MQTVSKGDNLHGAKVLFSIKNEIKKNNSNSHLLKLLPNMPSIKIAINTVLTLNIGKIKFLVLKFEQLHFTTCC